MKATELRIGNWVCHNGNWCHRNLSTPTNFQWAEYDWYAVGQCCMDLEDISPIPLTKEWLLKFGFKRPSPNSPMWEINKAGEGMVKINYLYFTEYDHVTHKVYQTTCSLVCFRYVHQLQNLYFALTGEELEIK